ncbi:MAG: hypothetical protein JST00_29485 [Deltaproteobacteria bacterium]|nr:hypothetical protein [Deltaproteobacteria bacterium]
MRAPSIALLVLAASLAACRATPSPRASNGNEADAAVDVARPPEQGATATIPTGSAPAAVPPKNRARPLGDGALGDILVGEPPSGAHPKGTVVAVAIDGGKSESAGLVEIDVATGNEVKRSRTLVTAVSAGVLTAREGDDVHVIAMQGSSIVWVTATRALAESHRLVTKPSGVITAGTARLLDFAVVGGKAFVAVDSSGVKVLVVDARGGVLATHDCHAFARPGGSTSSLLRVGPWVVVPDLIDDKAGGVLCGVRADATGKPLVRKLGFTLGVFTHGGVTYVEGESLRRLDDTLTPTGDAVADPRRCGERAEDCTPSEVAAHCDGLSGEGVAKMVSFGTVRVLRTLGCCGGPPGGVFVCEGPPR